MISDKELYEKFDKPNLKSQRWDDKFLKLKKENKLAELSRHLSTANELYLSDAYIAAYIKKSTFENVTHPNVLFNLIALSQNNYINYFDSIETDTLDQYTYIIGDNDGCEIEFRKLTEYLPILKEVYPELETTDRTHRCHIGCALMSRYQLDFPHEIVTGYTYNFSDKSKYLHTWIRFLDKNQEAKVIDYTMNAVLNEEGYNKIMHVDKKSLSIISSESIKAELDMIYDNPKFKNMDIRKYLLYREEVLSELNSQPTT